MVRAPGIVPRRPAALAHGPRALDLVPWCSPAGSCARQLAARCLFVCFSARLVFVDRYTNTGRAGLVAVDQVLAGLGLAGLVTRCSPAWGSPAW
jgi:hypothetical protein